MKKAEIYHTGGTKVILFDALTSCNLLYHKPYMAKLSPEGEMIWISRKTWERVNGTDECYCVDGLQPDDVIKCAGGKGGYKEPFCGIIKEITQDYLTVNEISSVEFSKIVRDRKRAAPLKLSAAAKRTIEEIRVYKLIREVKLIEPDRY